MVTKFQVGLCTGTEIGVMLVEMGQQVRMSRLVKE